MPGVPSFFKHDEIQSFYDKSIEKIHELPNFPKYTPISLKKTFLQAWLNKRTTVFTFLLFTLILIFTISHLFQREKGVGLYFSYLKSPCPDFIGRNNYLDVLKKDLLDGLDAKNLHHPTKLKVLWGKGGFGKSELAIQFANQFLNRFSFIWTFYCDNQEHLNQGYRDLAEKLGILNSTDTPDKIKEKVHFRLENHGYNLPWLLIYDNIENEFKDYPQRGGVILVTSKKKILNPEFILEVQPFSIEESLDLMEKITHEPRSETMGKLVQDLEGIPLLTNYVAHYIKSTPGCNVAEYQKLFSSHDFEKEGPFFLEMDINQRYSKSLSISWQFSLQSLKKENPLALQWLQVCSFLYPEHIPEEWIADWLCFGNSQENKESIGMMKNNILSLLQNYGIITYREKTKTFSIHRFFQYMIRENRKKEIKEDLGQAISLIEKHAHDYRYLRPGTWESAKQWYPHAAEIKKWIRQNVVYFTDDPLCLKRASIAEGLGLWYLYHSHYIESIDNLQEALDLIQPIQQQNILRQDLIYLSIGWDLYKLGRYKEGLKMCCKAEEIHQCYYKDKLLDNTYILNAKGSILFELGEHDEAIKYHKEALKIRQNLKGDEIYIIFVAQSLYSIALCMHQKGNYNEALQLFEESLLIQQKKYEKKQPLIVTTLVSKAEVLADQGHYYLALNLLKETLSNYRSLTDIYQAELTHIWNGMGKCLLHFSQLREARKKFKKALKQGLTYYGNQAPSSLISYNGIGWSYLKSMHIKKGLKYLVKELQISHQLYTDGPKKLLQALENFQKGLKWAWEKEGNTSHFKRALNLAQKISAEELGVDHPITQSLTVDFCHSQRQ